MRCLHTTRMRENNRKARSPRRQRLLPLTDMVALALGYSLYYYVRVHSGVFVVPVIPDFVPPLVVALLFWLLIFVIFGLYQPWHAKSRLDEFTTVVKAVTVGCLVLFFIIFVDDLNVESPYASRLLILLYWLIMITFVGGARLVLRSVQRRLLARGIGVQNTLIVGWNARGRELYDLVDRHRALGYRIVGFVKVDRRRTGTEYRGVPVLGTIEQLPEFLSKHDVRDLLIALESTDHNRLLEIMALCEGFTVSIKIVPDLYDIVSGQARTNQIYGFPLIEISPQLMPAWEEAVKRALDVCVSGVALIVGLPVGLLIAALVKLESPGPVLYRQERLGKDGEHFSIIKFRSMVDDAEKQGPQWAHRKDPRITRVGSMLRKLHLDELPQLWNVLSGHMSLVGPRPERPVFVEKLSKEIPLYPRRLKVRPGITGWAQVKHKYDESIDDVRKKVQYDLFYIENMSLRMDMKIILSTISHMLLGKGH